jgi:hypothetical protein
MGGNTAGAGTSETATAPAGAANTQASTPKSGTSTSRAQFGTIAGGFVFVGLLALVTVL